MDKELFDLRTVLNRPDTNQKKYSNIRSSKSPFVTSPLTARDFSPIDYGALGIQREPSRLNTSGLSMIPRREMPEKNFSYMDAIPPREMNLKHKHSMPKVTENFNMW